jgi:hypothetical protein
VLVLLMADRTSDLAKLTTFEECHLAAQVQAHELSQSKLSREERAQRFAKVIATLQRGLALAGRGDAPREVADARVMLAYAHLAGGDLYAAAVLGEHLGRSRLAGARAADATAYALQAYAAILAAGRRRGAPDDELRTDQRRLRALAELMERTWPDEPVTDVARHQLGSFLLADNNYPDAIAMLARIAPTYPGLAQARYEEGAAAQKAQSPAVKLPADQKKALLRRAIADLEAVPDPVPGASEESTVATCLAKLQLGNLLLIDEQPNGRNYERAEALGRTLADLAPKLGLDDQLGPQVATDAAKLRRAGAAGRAFVLLKADKVTEARKLLDPLVAQVRAELDGKAPHADEAWYQPYREVQREVLLLGMRAAILDGKPDAAQQSLQLLRKAAGGESDNDRLLRLVFDLKRDADALKAKGATAKRDALDKGLIAFLDELAKPKDLSPEARLFLAQAYAGLDRHDRAAALYKDYPPADAADAEAVKRAQAVRALLMREYRLAKDFTQAQAVLNDALASWGKTNLDVQREKVLLLEDAGKLADAHRACRQMQDALKKSWTDYERARRDERAADEAERVATSEDDRRKVQEARSTAQAKADAARPLRDAYWEFYFYEIRIVLKNDLKRAKDDADKERRLGSIAQAIKKLEDGQDDFGGGDLRDRYRELIDGEPVLKQKYVEAQGKRLLGVGE